MHDANQSLLGKLPAVQNQMSHAGAIQPRSSSALGQITKSCQMK